MEKDSTDWLPPTLRERCPTGTGYNNHRKHKEQACEACLQGARERNRRSYKRIFATKNANNKDKYKEWKSSTPTLDERLPPTIRPSCAFGKGYSLHRHYGELPCESCLKGRKESARKYEETNKERFLENNRAKNRLRRARKLDVIHEDYSTQDVLDLYGTDCHICHDPIDLALPRRVGQEGWEKGLQVDHVVPLKRGGNNTLENVRPSHGLCNVKKGARQYDIPTTLTEDPSNDS